MAAVFHRRRRVQVGMHDAAANRWVGVDEASAVDRDDLTLATFNVWFDDYFAERRYRAIADLLCREMPDVMVFQEITPTALDVLLAQPWIQEHYRRAAVVGAAVGNYGMLMLSRLPTANVTYTRLPTRLSRGFLQAEFTVNGSPLVVCSVHLDSGKRSARLRARQLRRVFRALRSADDAVVLGDFNMRDHRERADRPALSRRMADAAAERRRLHRGHVHQPHAFRQQEQAQAGAFRPRAPQGRAMGGREHRTAGHPTDFKQPPPGLSIRSLRRDVPPVRHSAVPTPARPRRLLPGWLRRHS